MLETIDGAVLSSGSDARRRRWTPRTVCCRSIPTNLKALVRGDLRARNASADSITDPTAQAGRAGHRGQLCAEGIGGAQAGWHVRCGLYDAEGSCSIRSSTARSEMPRCNKKDTATAIDAYKKELAVGSARCHQDAGPSAAGHSTFWALAYMQSTPPDYLNCAFYTSRAVALRAGTYKAQYAPTAKYCYKKYHGADDGYDAVVAAATANLNPPAGFRCLGQAGADSGGADPRHHYQHSGPGHAGDLGQGDVILQNGTPEDAAKVWDTIKGKSFQIPGALVIASTPTQLQVAVSDDAVQSKTADFTFNLTAPERSADEEAATPAAKAAYKKNARRMRWRLRRGRRRR